MQVPFAQAGSQTGVAHVGPVKPVSPQSQVSGAVQTPFAQAGSQTGVEHVGPVKPLSPQSHVSSATHAPPFAHGTVQTGSGQSTPATHGHARVATQTPATHSPGTSQAASGVHDTASIGA